MLFNKHVTVSVLVVSKFQKEETTTIITTRTTATTGSMILMITINYQMWELFGQQIMMHFFL